MSLSIDLTTRTLTPWAISSSTSCSSTLVTLPISPPLVIAVSRGFTPSTIC
jgi:hypothetical protein